MILWYLGFIASLALMIICGRQGWWREAVILAVPCGICALMALQRIAGGPS